MGPATLFTFKTEPARQDKSCQQELPLRAGVTMAAYVPELLGDTRRFIYRPRAYLVFYRFLIELTDRRTCRPETEPISISALG
jgi:hypothetical protein